MILRHCTCCFRPITLEAWLGLELVGRQQYDPDHFMLEIRNHDCASPAPSLSVIVTANPPADREAVRVGEWWYVTEGCGKRE